MSIKKALININHAIKEDNAGNYNKALYFYITASENFITAIKSKIRFLILFLVFI